MLTNILVTLLVAALAIGLPLIDRMTCRHFNLHPGLSKGDDPRQKRLLALRNIILFGIFAIYALAVAYLVFFSRAAGEEYRIHVKLMGDLREAITFDTSYLGVLETILEYGLAEGLSKIHIENLADVSQVYLNIMLFVPFGYLLPYCVNRFRTNTVLRVTFAGFATSFLVENLQLVFKRGFYDADDLLSNTIGALVGAILFRIFAFAVTHPDWRREMRGYHRYKRFILTHHVYPFANKAISSRITLYASVEKAADDFYTRRLGFRRISRIVPPDGHPTILYRMGGTELELVCVGEEAFIPPQYLTFTVGNLERVHNKLSKHDLDVSEFSHDDYSLLRKFTFKGPDNLTVAILG